MWWGWWPHEREAVVSKRARYDGPLDKVVVHLPPGVVEGGADDYQTWEVERGHQLPADAPAKLRDELTAGSDWTEVDQSDGKNSDDKSGKGE